MKDSRGCPHAAALACILGFLAIGALPNTAALAGQAQVPSDFAIAQALPPAVSGWQKSRDDRVYSRDDIFDYHEGAGDLYLAFDLRFVFVREYSKPEAPVIVVEIHQMSSAADAFGIFTQDRRGREVHLGQDALYDGGSLWFWKGDVFVRIKAERESPEAKDTVMQLGGAIDSTIFNAGLKPEILARLPVESLEPGTVRYFHTVVSLNSQYFMSNVNVLNLSPETQVVMARYKEGRAQGTLILVEYPSEERAFSAYGRFIEIFLLKRFAPDRSFPPVKLENGKYAGAVPSGRWLAIVVEADKEAMVVDLLKRASTKI